MQPKECILVLGSGVTPDGSLTLIGKSRVEKGVEIFKRGYAQRILFCGGYSYKLQRIPQKSEAKAMQDYAISLGIPKNYTYIEEQSRDTLGNAYFAKIFLEKQNWRSFFVVTSNIYLPKTDYAFRKVFGKEFAFEIIPCLTYLTTEELIDRVDSEKGKMKLYQESLGSISDGDDTGVRKAMSAFPWYTQILRTTGHI